MIWGHSQGGHAALWAGQIAPRYAPGLTVKGIAALAPASDLYALAQETKAGIGGKTVSAYIVTAWDHEYPDLHLADHLTPGTAQGVEQVAGLCFNQQDAIAAFLRGSQIPDQVIPDAMLDGEVGDLLRRNTPTGPFPAPVLVMQGTADPLVTPTMQAHWVAERCAQGRPVDYRTVPGRGHMELVAADSPVNAELISWTLARWNGAPATPTCGVR
ncbi:lipase family protein [Gordonia sp. PP30]|uniref:lipase family protein n=1 Tax=Gordonia sp. PP30 TaxID=2935861 RepID=UPI001FFE99DE|nr:lipase family protein [Gordonia sp. PP30]UQE74099.1 lipase family protein [Gordonia sp. PP30]